MDWLTYMSIVAIFSPFLQLTTHGNFIKYRINEDTISFEQDALKSNEKLQNTMKIENSLENFIIQSKKKIDPFIKNLNSGKENVKPVLECMLCKTLVGVVQILMESMKTTKEIQNIVTEVCIFLKIKDKNVCTGIIREFKEEVLTVFDQVVLSPENFCGTILGEECAHVHHPHEFWNISLNDIPKPPVTQLKYPPAGLPTIRILHLSDIHVDFNYKVGGNAECGEPVCCKDIDGKPKGKPAGKWGDYRQCDTPPKTLDNLFSHLRKKEKFDAIYWTGDLPGHNVWNQTKKGQLELLDYLAKHFQTYFPNVPVFSTLGNHESVPVNSFPPPFIKGKNSIDWLYNKVQEDWSRWLPKDTFNDIKRGAFYTLLLRPGLRLISLNMNYCNYQNWWMLINNKDPVGQLQWLIDVLQYAEDSGEKVHIIGHIPPGIGVCLKPWSWNYYKIVNRYESTITGQFFGHTHTDFFEIFYDDDHFKRPTSIAYVSPSVTTYPNLNPGYRIYTVDGVRANSTFYVLDHETYYLDLDEANRTNVPVWRKEYSVKETYGMQSLFPLDWHEFSLRLLNNRTLFDTFYRNSYKQSPKTKEKCDDHCRKDWICDLWSARSSDPQLCAQIKSPAEFKEYFYDSFNRHRC